jgi:hypothetical protein
MVPTSSTSLIMRASSRWLAAGIATAFLAACSDSSTSPRPASSHGPSLAPPSFDFSATAFALGFTQNDFVVGAAGGSFSIGGLYTVNFPANSVCDPAQSSYGPTEWDKPCVTLGNGQSVTLHATLTLSAGGLAVDFSPAVRFSPSTVVTISTDIFAPVVRANSAYFASNPAALNSLAILYSTNLGSAGLSDYSKDASVITHVDLTTGRIWRRVKHFSGYSIISGEACDPSPDNPDCVEVDDKG